MNYFEPSELLEIQPSRCRAAYSDRMAWLMASMSQLAYFKFEVKENEFAAWAEKIKKLTSNEEIQDFLKKKLVPNLAKTSGKVDLQKELKSAGFQLVEIFDEGGTQAFLAKQIPDRSAQGREKIAVLAFRGTETTQLKDIITDLNAFVTDDSGSRVHTGFKTAFNEVKRKVQAEIKKLKGYSIFITGHSLGGALALIATRELVSDNIAACYTFGSPRVGSSEFADSIKPPIYRVVNTADIVPRLPPGLFIEVAVDILRFLRGVFPFLEFAASWLDDKVSGYRHHGDMRYLTHCKKADCSDVRLISNISFLDRCRRLFKNRISLNKHIGDHDIAKYCMKLAAHARNRNTESL